MSARVLFLEMDAGDKFLIEQWAQAGILPTFRDLFARALVGDTISPEGFFVGAIWPSLYTGVNPARHGIHSLVQLVPGTYEFRRHPTGESIRREPFWNALSEAGKRLAILDIPLSGLSKKINGIQSVEWGAHDANYGFCAWPPEFEADVRQRFGPHPFTKSCNDHGVRPEDFIELRDMLIAGVRKKAELTQHYLRGGEWDFFAQVFTESHCIGHQCWHLHDRDHPAHDPRISEITGDPVREVYVEIDRALGQILRQVSEQTTVIVLSGHRMSHKRGAQFLLPQVLARLNVAELPRPRAPDAIDRVDSIMSSAWQLVPRRLKQLLTPLKSAVRERLDARQPGVPPSVSALDAARSHCFLTDNGFPVSGLRLNLKGREPAGLIAPGTEAEAFCAQLGRDLLELRDADSGVPMVSSVKRTADLYQGEYLGQLPDLLVEWSDDKRLGSAGCGNPAGSLVRLCSPKIGLIEGVNRYCRTGDHRPEGIFFAVGPDIRPGRLDRTLSIMDFAPTFAALLGVELSDVDGQSIAEIAGNRSSQAAA